MTPLKAAESPNTETFFFRSSKIKNENLLTAFDLIKMKLFDEIVFICVFCHRKETENLKNLFKTLSFLLVKFYKISVF